MARKARSKLPPGFAEIARAVAQYNATVVVPIRAEGLDNDDLRTYLVGRFRNLCVVPADRDRDAALQTCLAANGPVFVDGANLDDVWRQSLGKKARGLGFRVVLTPQYIEHKLAAHRAGRRGPPPSDLDAQLTRIECEGGIQPSEFDLLVAHRVLPNAQEAQALGLARH